MTLKSLVIVALRRKAGGFTLAELLVSVFVLLIIVFMVAQLMTSATAITRTGNKHIDTDTQARVVLDRMALDFAQMLKRTTDGGRGTTETKAATRSLSLLRRPVITLLEHNTLQRPKARFRW
jgi:Tfp pilus assembly protein PilV